VVAEWKYALLLAAGKGRGDWRRRSGSGSLSSGSIPFIISPLLLVHARVIVYLNDGISLPSTISVGEDRGLANCPAILAIRTTGNLAPIVKTTHHSIYPRSILNSFAIELLSSPRLGPTVNPPRRQESTFDE
jgi:hypothetical protein